MTLHIHYNHQCPDCGAYYVPYDDDVPCPRCGAVEEERFDYISRAADSVIYNMQMYGSYLPPAWWVGSLGDHILLLLFHLFEGFRLDEKDETFGDFAREMLNEMDWGEQEYLRDHVYAIALRVYDEIDFA